MTNDRPQGQRFSHLYLERTSGIQDSPRIRRRISSLFWSLNINDVSGIARNVEGETGEKIPFYSGYSWTQYFENCPLDTLVDLPTVVARLLLQAGLPSKAKSWIGGIERIFREEQSAYTLDAKGGVHPYVDAAFNADRLSAIDALRGDRYSTAAASLAKAYDNLHGSPLHARDAIRHSFDAAENIFKMMTGKARLTAADAKGLLTTLIDQQLGNGNPVAKRASHQMLNSFADWVDACHNYRHAPGEAEPPEPPEIVWQLLMTQAAGFIRWLARLDQQLKRP